MIEAWSNARARLLDVFRGLKVARRFRQDLGPHALQLAGIGGLSLGAVLFEILKPWPIQWIFDHALVPRGEQSHPASFVIWTGVLAALVFVLARAALDYTCAVRTKYVAQGVTRSLRYRIFRQLTELGPGFHARHKSGDLLVRLMGDVPMLRTMLVDSFLALATRCILIVGTLAVMFRVDARLTWILIALAPVFVFTLRALSMRLTTAVRKQRKKEGQLADFAHEAIVAAPLVQSLGRTEHTVSRFARSNRRSVRAELKAAKLSAGLSASVESLLGVGLALALFFGSWRVIENQLSAGELLVFLSYVRSLLKPARASAKHSDKIARGTACGERILTILDEPLEVESRPDARPTPLEPKTLAFEDVHYSYTPQSRALSGVSVTFERGRMVGVFGKSGSGKSTLAALALRLFDPDQGRVTVDGADIREFDLNSLRERFGLCMQEPVLFGETVRENLLLGKPDASDEALAEALHAAAADGFVERLPEGLDSCLGSAGAGLSGGERRRLCLARTLLRDAPLLIVDEPFAGLDRPNVERLSETLRALARERLVMIIAHDLATLDAFDHVVFLEDGRVADQGTHDELMRRNADYRKTLRVQKATAV